MYPNLHTRSSCTWDLPTCRNASSSKVLYYPDDFSSGERPGDLFGELLVRENALEMRRGIILPIVDGIEIIEFRVEEIACGGNLRLALKGVEDVGFPAVFAVVDAVPKRKNVPIYDETGELTVFAFRQVIGGGARVVAASRP